MSALALRTGAGLPLPVPDPYQLGQQFGDLIKQQQGGRAGGASSGNMPTPAPAPAPAPPPPSPGMSTTNMILIGAGVIGAGIIIYAVATAKRRR
jgi:hypothetical protein